MPTRKRYFSPLHSFLPTEASSLRGALNLQVVVSGTTARPGLLCAPQCRRGRVPGPAARNTALSVDYKGRSSAQLGSQLVTTDEKSMGGIQLAAQTPLTLGIRSPGRSSCGS